MNPKGWHHTDESVTESCAFAPWESSQRGCESWEPAVGVPWLDCRALCQSHGRGLRSAPAASAASQEHTGLSTLGTLLPPSLPPPSFLLPWLHPFLHTLSVLHTAQVSSPELVLARARAVQLEQTGSALSWSVSWLIQEGRVKRRVYCHTKGRVPSFAARPRSPHRAVVMRFTSSLHPSLPSLCAYLSLLEK